MRKLSTKNELATLAGVHASSISRLTQKHPEVLDGQRIIMDHEIVQNYLESHVKKVLPSGAPVFADELYEEVARYCKKAGYWTQYSICKNFQIGKGRASKLIQAMALSGLKSQKEPPATPVKYEPPTKPKPKPKPKPRSKKTEVVHPVEVDPLPPEADEDTKYGLMEIPADIRDVAHWPLIKIIRKFGTMSGFDTYLKSVKLMEEITERRIKNYKANGELVPKDAVVAQVFEPLDICFSRMLRDGSRAITSVLRNQVKAGDTFEQCEEEVKKQMSTFIKPVKNKLKRGLQL